jgi:hypothetical protein
MITTYKATPDIDVLTSSFPIPGFGLVPINAFVLHGPEPILVDTGTVIDSDEFISVAAGRPSPKGRRYLVGTSASERRRRRNQARRPRRGDPSNSTPNHATWTSRPS